MSQLGNLRIATPDERILSLRTARQELFLRVATTSDRELEWKPETKSQVHLAHSNNGTNTELRKPKSESFSSHATEKNRSDDIHFQSTDTLSTI